jgi:hypothetical protein
VHRPDRGERGGDEHDEAGDQALEVLGKAQETVVKTVSQASDYVADVLPVMLLLGFGAGLAFPSLMTLAMSSATPSDAGLASGLVNTTLQVGGAIGLAVLATLATDRTQSLLGDGESMASALTSGYHVSFWIGAGLVVAAIAVAVTVLQAVPKGAQHAPGDEEQPAYSEAA